MSDPKPHIFVKTNVEGVEIDQAVEAVYIEGQLAVHESLILPQEYGHWSITHIPSGLRAVGGRADLDLFKGLCHYLQPLFAVCPNDVSPCNGVYKAWLILAMPVLRECHNRIDLARFGEEEDTW